MTSQELSGTNALVTGAGRGFGRAVAIALDEAGADVVAVARNEVQIGPQVPHPRAPDDRERSPMND